MHCASAAPQRTHSCRSIPSHDGRSPAGHLVAPSRSWETFRVLGTILPKCDASGDDRTSAATPSASNLHADHVSGILRVLLLGTRALSSGANHPKGNRNAD